MHRTHLGSVFLAAPAAVAGRWDASRAGAPCSAHPGPRHRTDATPNPLPAGRRRCPLRACRVHL